MRRRSLLSLILILALVFTYTGAAFANSNVEGNAFSRKKQNEDLHLLSLIGLSDVNVVNNFNEYNSTAYEYRLPSGEKAYILAEQTKEGIEYTFIENDKKDILCFMNDGRVKIDGHIVTYGESDEPIIINLGNESRARYNQYKSTPFVGTVADYDTYVKSTKDGWVSLGKALAAFTTSALAVFIAELFALEVSGNIFTGFCISMSTGLISNAKSNAPTSKNMSTIYDIYEYEGAGSPLDHYYKYVVKCYPKSNYAGSATKGNYYVYNYFS